MTSPAEPDTPSSADGSPAVSILFPGPAAVAGIPPEPACFTDLNLDQLVATVTADRPEYDLRPLFRQPLDRAADVTYRQAVARDLERSEVQHIVLAFARGMRDTRCYLGQARQARHPLQRSRLFLDAAASYCDAIGTLGADLPTASPASPGMLSFAQYLTHQLASPAHLALRGDAARVQQALAAISYTVHIKGSRITVSSYQQEPDYGEDVRATFAKFRHSDTGPGEGRSRFPALLEADQVEASILERVALLFPAAFDDLTTFFARWQNFLDPVISRFDREAQFFLSYLDYLTPLRSAGLAFCYPTVCEHPAPTLASGLFDLVLAARLTAESLPVICNDLSLRDSERVLVVTGPNQGGKTTFARALGQLHYLASLGLPVPGSAAALGLPDAIFTQFEREEDIETGSGKLADDLTRLRDILQQASARSVIILNEVLTSATTADAADLGVRLLDRVAMLGSLCACVTFLDELASAGPHTVSMVAEVSPHNPAERTYQLTRRPADGLAYAQAVAEKHGLSYERLKARVTG